MGEDINKRQLVPLSFNLLSLQLLDGPSFYSVQDHFLVFPFPCDLVNFPKETVTGAWSAPIRFTNLMVNVFIECYRVMLAYFQHSLNLFQTKNAVVYWDFSVQPFSSLLRLHFTLQCIHNYRTLSVVFRSNLERWLRYLGRYSDTLTTGVCYEVLKVKEFLAVSVWGDGRWVMRWRVGEVHTDSIQMPTDVATCLPQWGPTVNLYCHKLTIIKWTLFISPRKGGCIRTSAVLCS